MSMKARLSKIDVRVQNKLNKNKLQNINLTEEIAKSRKERKLIG